VMPATDPFADTGTESCVFATISNNRRVLTVAPVRAPRTRA
jgi:hypothetical protein